MRSVLLQEKANEIFGKDLSLTARMDEESAMGACRICHLLLNNRIRFSEDLKNCGVYDPEEVNNNLFGKDTKSCYYVSCSPDYLQGIKECVWKSLDKCSEEELNEFSEGELC